MVDRDQGGQNCARIVLNDGAISFQTFNYQVLLGRTDQYVLMIPKLPSVNGEFVVEDYFKNNKIKELTKKDIDNKFLSNTRFKQFPTVKDNLKKELLPDFCKNEASAADMEDFKLLLDKIQEIILL